MTKNVRRQTFEESGVTIQAYPSLRSSPVQCSEHDYEKKRDVFEHEWSQCKVCGQMKESYINLPREIR